MKCPVCGGLGYYWIPSVDVYGDTPYWRAMRIKVWCGNWRHVR